MNFLCPIKMLSMATCWVWAILVTFGVAGCAQKPGVVFDPANAQWVWPAPPDPPRVRFVGELTADTDLKAGRSFAAALTQTLFGSEPPKQFVSPNAVCTDGRSRLFVSDSQAQLIHVMDLRTRKYEQWTPDEDVAFLEHPAGLCYDAAGRLYVSDSLAGLVHVFDDVGNWLGTLGQDHLSRPAGLALDNARAHLYVADAAAHQVVVLSLDGQLVRRIGERGWEPGKFNFPTNVAFDSRDQLYVSDSLNFRIQVFDENDQLVSQVGSKGDRPGYFAQPKGIALDSEDHLYVVDAQFESVQLFNANGDLLLNFGNEGHDPGEFWLPSGIWIDENDRIWIADVYNRRVQVFDYLREEKQ